MCRFTSQYDKRYKRASYHLKAGEKMLIYSKNKINLIQLNVGFKIVRLKPDTVLVKEKIDLRR